MIHTTWGVAWSSGMIKGIRFVRTEILLFALISVGILGSASMSSAADHQCPPIPIVFWWVNTTHERVIRHVQQRYGGNWDDYLAAWHNRLLRLQDMQGRGSRVEILGQDIVLAGRGLEAYVKVVADRLDIMRCLAEEERILSRPGDAATGEALAASLKCANCHGRAGISEHDLIPNLANQRPEYLRAQLWFFRDASMLSKTGPPGMPVRHDRLMSQRAGGISDRDIAHVATYYAGLPCGTSVRHENFAPPKVVTRCAACHGEDGRSRNAGFPNIAGQKELYLHRQLTLLRQSMVDGGSAFEEVDVRYHGMMGRQAQIMSEGEIKELARYYSHLPCG
jgi:cytochrome c553